MTKTATRPEKVTFYRPHARVVFDGTITNPVTGEVTKPASMTKQEHKAECDINNILKQYKQTGMIRHIASQGPIYADLPSDIDFQGSLNMVLDAQNAFSTLPSKVRERFANDPQRFLAFMADPSNADEIIKLGLATKRPEPKLEADAGGAGSKESPKPASTTSSPPPDGERGGGGAPPR